MRAAKARCRAKFAKPEQTSPAPVPTPVLGCPSGRPLGEAPHHQAAQPDPPKGPGPPACPGPKAGPHQPPPVAARLNPDRNRPGSPTRARAVSNLVVAARLNPAPISAGGRRPAGTVEALLSLPDRTGSQVCREAEGVTRIVLLPRCRCLVEPGLHQTGGRRVSEALAPPCCRRQVEPRPDRGQEAGDLLGPDNAWLSLPAWTLSRSGGVQDWEQRRPPPRQSPLQRALK
jgi:hypothetical protein